MLISAKAHIRSLQKHFHAVNIFYRLSSMKIVRPPHIWAGPPLAFCRLQGQLLSEKLFGTMLVYLC